jgi:hypothetical protein
LVGPARAGDGGDEGERLHGSIEIADLDEIVARESCVMFYEGNLCRSFGTSWGELAPACQEVHRRFELEPFASTRYREHIYDPADARGDCGETRRDFDSTTTEPATLRIYRVRPAGGRGALPQSSRRDSPPPDGRPPAVVCAARFRTDRS